MTIEGDRQVVTKFNRLAKRATLQKLGPGLWRLFSGFERELFQTEGASGPDRKWKPLRDVTLARKRANRQSPRILEADGKLKKSLTGKRKGPDSVLNVTRDTIELGTKVPYAKHHQYGAPRAKIPRRSPVAITKAQKREMIAAIRHFIVTGERPA